MASIVIAPTGGMYILEKYMTVSIMQVAAIAETVSGISIFTESIYLDNAPMTEHNVITAIVFTGLFLVLFRGRENSVNATNKGGATTNLKPDLIAAKAITATQIILSVVSIQSSFECSTRDNLLRTPQLPLSH